MKKIIYLLIIFSIFCIFSVNANAAERTSGIFKYELLSDGSATITGFSGDFSGALTIPYKLNNGIIVKSVGAGAFRGNNNITKLTIEAGVKTISIQAFMSCNSITDITIYEGVTTLGEYAFAGCSAVKTMVLPASLTNIEFYALRNLSSLESIDVAASNTKFLDYNGDLYTKGKKTLLRYCSGKAASSFVVPSEVTIIGEHAFSDSHNLKSVILPSGLKSIQMNSFLDCTNLQGIHFPESLQSIGEGAFNYCTSITEIEIPANVQTFGDGIFANCTSLKRVSFAEGIEAVGDSMFYHCTNLRWVSLPGSMEDIYPQAFQSCVGLTCVSYAGTEEEWEAVVIWDGNDALKTADFQFDMDFSMFTYQENADETVTITGCSKTSGNVVIPDYIYEMPVSNIGADAFLGSRISSVVLPKYLENIYASAFESCYGLIDITCPDSLRTISSYAFSDCLNLKNVKLNEGLLEIGAYAFNGCATLKEIKIPSTVSTILDFAFTYSPALEKIDVDSNNTSYSSIDGVLLNRSQSTLLQYPMAKRAALYHVPASVTTIGKASFYACDVNYIYLSDSVRFINNNAFKNSMIQRIRIPQSIIFILNDAFYGCSQLKEVYVAKEGDAWSGVTINNGNSALTGATVLCYRVAEEEVTVTKCATNAKGVVNIPKKIENKSVVAIGDDAFKNCASVTEINLPLSMKSIGVSAFENCGSLSSVNIPENVSFIGNRAFSGCGQLRDDVYYGGNEYKWAQISSNISLTSATVNYNCIYKSQFAKVFCENEVVCVQVTPNSNLIGKDIIFVAYQGNKIANLQISTYKNEAPVFHWDSAYDGIKLMAWNSVCDIKPQTEADGYHIDEL